MIDRNREKKNDAVPRVLSIRRSSYTSCKKGFFLLVCRLNWVENLFYTQPRII